MTATERGLNEIKSTEGIDCETVMLSGGKVSIWDFAGQIEYTATHQFFLSVEVFFKKIFLFHSIKCCFIFFETSTITPVSKKHITSRKKEPLSTTPNQTLI